jgi:hypothetical protein
MAALVRNYTIERGIQFSRQITITSGSAPLDLTGATVAAEVRVSRLPTEFRPFATGTGPLVTSFDAALAVDPTTGIFTITLPIAKTLLLARGDYDYDVVITFADAKKRRILMGILTITEITTHA